MTEGSEEIYSYKTFLSTFRAIITSVILASLGGVLILWFSLRSAILYFVLVRL